MATEYKIDINKRDDITRQGIKKLRKEGNIPGVYYSSSSKESSGIKSDLSSKLSKKNESIYIKFIYYKATSMPIFKTGKMSV